jgi:glycosyltransferase involved in cell wall biosynthesis
MHEHVRLDGRHVVFFSWRDTTNPEGGGAELYLEHMARGLVERGAKVTVFCASHSRAPSTETVAGVRLVRRGSKLSVYLVGFLMLLTGRFGKVDVVVDVQNGLPFFTRLATRRPVVVLVHHVHREQWPVVYPGVTGRVGWWIESWLAPRLYRSCQYVAVSQATRRELAELGVDRERVAVVHNGTAPELPIPGGKSDHPSMCVVGRLVPHKQVEHAIDAWQDLTPHVPDLRLTVVGDGWWAEELHEHARRAGGAENVVFTGHVSELAKQEVYAGAWVMVLPSLKEGWGLVVGEAGRHRTPTVAYRSAGGTRESVVDDYSGMLVDDYEELVVALRSVLTDANVRAKLSEGAVEVSRRFTWDHAHGSFAIVLEGAMLGQRTSSQDPDEDESVSET